MLSLGRRANKNSASSQPSKNVQYELEGASADLESLQRDRVRLHCLLADTISDVDKTKNELTACKGDRRALQEELEFMRKQCFQSEQRCQRLEDDLLQTQIERDAARGRLKEELEKFESRLAEVEWNAWQANSSKSEKSKGSKSRRKADSSKGSPSSRRWGLSSKSQSVSSSEVSSVEGADRENLEANNHDENNLLKERIAQLSELINDSQSDVQTLQEDRRRLTNQVLELQRECQEHVSTIQRLHRALQESNVDDVANA